jgi:hypothetical protein
MWSKRIKVGTRIAKKEMSLTIFPTLEIRLNPILFNSFLSHREKIMKTLAHFAANSTLRSHGMVARLQTFQRAMTASPRMVSRPRNHCALPGMESFIPKTIVKSEQVKLIPINGLREPMQSTTRILPPKQKILVSPHELPKGQPGDDFWGIGRLDFPIKTEAMDDFDTHRELNVKSFLPGDAAPKNVRKSAYDTRPFKYLWTLDQKGLNVVREMLRFKSSRGIVLHSKVSPMAVVGGEAWFCPKENAVYINFCSGRYPLKDQKSIDTICKLWLNFYKNVYAVVPPERYGEVTPVWYQRDDAINAAEAINTNGL